MKKIVALLLTGILTASLLGGCSKKDELVMGLDTKFPPMGFTDENGEIVGFDIDLADAVAEKMGVTFKKQPIDWNSKELELNGGKVDLLWNGLTITDERAEDMTFTKPYLKNRQVVVVLKDSSYQKLADLSGKNVVLQKGSTAVDALNDDSNKAFADSLKEAVQLGEYATCFMELDKNNGAAEAVLVDEVVAKYYLSEHEGKYRILEESLADEFYGIAVKKGNTELRDKIQNALDELYKEGKIKEICEKWFGEDIYYTGE